MPSGDETFRMFTIKLEDMNRVKCPRYFNIITTRSQTELSDMLMFLSEQLRKGSYCVTSITVRNLDEEKGN